MSGEAPESIGVVRRALARRLAAAGLEAAELEARLLLCHVLACPPAALLSRASDPVSPEMEAALEAVVARRLAGEPVARIVGHREFWSMPFRLNADTLVPRPDTETVVEAALEALPGRRAPLRILDLGVGSGAILAALLAERPRAFGVGVDLAEGAARAARDNLARAGLGERAAILVGSWGDALKGGFDLVVSNPPYIRRCDIASLAQDVRLYDPQRALDGGVDGLDAYRAIISELPQLLVRDGIVVLELGQGQEADVAALLRAAGLEPLGAARPDLAGIPRALVARKS